MSSKPSLKLDWCSHEAAKYAVEKWHYSKRMPIGKMARIGIWEDGVFVGVVIYALGANKDMAARFCCQNEACELVRIAMTSHKTSVSKVISITMKMLRKQSPGIRLIVSYADPSEGHHGGVYQASGWLYVGESQKTTEWFHEGRWKHNREMTGGPFGEKRRIATSGIESRKKPGKHKYLMPLDEAMRKQIEPLRKPYPNRVRSVVSDTSAIHAEEGSATLTRTL